MIVDLPQSNYPRLVIIGGGFAGVTLARALKNKEVQIVLIDKNNYHTFQPLLYQVATAGLSPDSIAYPLRKIFRGHHNVSFRMAEVINIDSSNKTVETTIGKVDYDYLVIATGSKTNCYGIKDIEENGMQMKSVPEALDLRSLILQNFEKALLTTDVKERVKQMSIAVVGGGPTGVEISGALTELKRHVMPSDYPELDTRRMQIHLVEMLPRVLTTMSEEASEKAQKFLKKMGVSIWLNAGVKSYDGETVYLSNGKTLMAKTLIWSAGVVGATIPGIEKCVIARGERFVVDEFNMVQGTDNVFAIGDVACMQSEENPKGHPMVAPVAIQQAKVLSENIIKKINGEEMKPFKYFDKGSMATVGRNKAVVDLYNLKSQGFLAWFIWLFVHLLYLVGFRNKMVVLINWMWNYLSYDKAIRLIIRPFDADGKKRENRELVRK